MAETVIARRWASIIRTQDKAAYTDYVRHTGISDYGATDGNLGFQMMLRDLGHGTTEVVIISWWASIDAIRAFAGEDYQRARYYPEDDRYLLEKPDRVEHGDVVIDGLALSS
jgi:heme-degrading monooxygenase HmoA